ncbi:uncharacterized protein METZ01_LOCUS437706, partial [marine metagenome]
MFQLLRRLVRHLGRRRQTQFLAILVAMLVSGVFEFASIGSVFPFIAALSDPDHAATYPIVRQAVELFNVGKPESLVLLLAVGFGTAVVVSGISRMLVLWLTLR